MKRSRDFNRTVQMARSSSGLATVSCHSTERFPTAKKNLSWVSLGFGQKFGWDDARLKYPALYFSHVGCVGFFLVFFSKAPSTAKQRLFPNHRREWER